MDKVHELPPKDFKKKLPLITDKRLDEVKRLRFSDIQKVQRRVVSALFQFDPEDMNDTPKEIISILAVWLSENGAELSKTTCQVLEYNEGLSAEQKLSFDEIVQEVVIRFDTSDIPQNEGYRHAA